METDTHEKVEEMVKLKQLREAEENLKAMACQNISAFISRTMAIGFRVGLKVGIFVGIFLSLLVYLIFR